MKSRPPIRPWPPALAIALVLACGAPAGQAEVTSIADWPCREWTARRTSGARADAPQMWLAGYLTGLATALRVDALAITDAEAVFEWMDGFCREHPDELVSTGGGILFSELVGRLPTTPPQLSVR